MSQLIIGLHGLARTGKDTLAAYLAAHFALYSYAFADPLKQALAHMFNLTQAQLDGAEKEQVIDWLGKSPRQLMQLLGTEWGREQVHPRLWLLLAEQNLNHAFRIDQTDFAGVVLRDVRFENEAAWVRAKGGTVVHILRPDAQAVAAHKSESGLSIHDADCVLHNDGSLQEFFSKADNLMSTLKHRQQHKAA